LLARTYLLFAQQNFNRWQMIFDHQLSEGQQVPDWYQKKVNQVFKGVELQFERLSANHSKQQSKQAAHALWCGVHGICTLSLTGKLDLIEAENIEDTVDLLVKNFIRGWK
jgi:hypothetical protein